MPPAPPAFELTRRLEFSAAHRLWNPAFTPERNRAVFGPCANRHGHNYVLEVTVRGPVDPATGMVLDLNWLAGRLNELVFADVDHKDLDQDVPWLAGRVSTAENVVAALWERLAPHFDGRLWRLRLYESAANVVDYHGPGR
jgi:6-pyruvoyltetrahydropterin/6-carboxytetrahydropterin synthase